MTFGLFLTMAHEHSPAGLHVSFGSTDGDAHSLRQRAAEFRRVYGWGGHRWRPWHGGWRTEPHEDGRWWEIHRVEPLDPNRPARLQLRGGLSVWPEADPVQHEVAA